MSRTNALMKKKHFQVTVTATIEVDEKFTKEELESMLIVALIKDDDSVILDEPGSDTFFVIDYQSSKAVELA